MKTTFRCAVVTPYHKEERFFLERCLDSVKAQTVTADHIVVSDGYPQEWLSDQAVRHIKLDRSHGDYGNTPRGIGALLAIGEEYDAILFLDADNWIAPTHIETCLNIAKQRFGDVELCDYVIARRSFMRPDETMMPLDEEQNHVDTNCFFFLRGSFHLLPFWATMPKAVSAICDRVFLGIIRQNELNWVVCPEPTVFYHCTWAPPYRDIGEEPPAGAKERVDVGKIAASFGAWSDRKKIIASRLTGGLRLFPRQ